jgi:hypothetical protein
MEKITTKGKVRIYGSWDDSGMEVYWHPKSDYLMYRYVNDVLNAGKYLTPLYEFGQGMMPLEMRVCDDGTIDIELCSNFDRAVLMKKLELHGFVNFIFSDDDVIKFTTDDELAMFQVYFSDFIV